MIPFPLHGIARFFLTLCLTLPLLPLSAQQEWNHYPAYLPDPVQRTLDSIFAVHIPVLQVPAESLSTSLPDSIDNSHYPWFAGILDQDGFMSCQQYCGPGYTFAYEINRLRQLDGTLPENRYAPHYTWHFFNKGANEGVNFLHSFHAMMSQGHMSNADWGSDTGKAITGWIDGYDKYYRAMHNRIRHVWAIPVNSAEGIQTVKQYLFDHLDGSSTGGILCFTSSSPSMMGFGGSILPPDSPEAGKYVITAWMPHPTHGMTIVGYHDSIRVDLNEDGQYSNDIDINEDGVIDARDWEIGGFRLANSYGEWWADQGYFYVLYSAMASEFLEGGIWNEQVYVVEPDPDYSPLLTVSIDLEHNARNQLNIMAGVNADPNAQFPDHIIEFPIFHNQGGSLWMQGFDTLTTQKRMEFGLDVTPLADYIQPGEAVRFFLLIEEQNPKNTGIGQLHGASFHWYGPGHQEFVCEGSPVPIRHNGNTLVSTTGTITFDPPAISTGTLPPLTAGNPYAVQVEATQGVPPYSFSLVCPFTRAQSAIPYQPVTASLVTPQSSYKPYAAVGLPFSFPFNGKLYDTVYMNAAGMIHFTDAHLPYPYLMDPRDMLNYTPSIAPACNEALTIWAQDGDGMWVQPAADSMIFRWKLSILGVETQTNLEFNAILYPDGSVLMAYGPIEMNTYQTVCWQSITAGDNVNVSTTPLFPVDQQSGYSYLFSPPNVPASLEMTPQGFLTLMPSDSTIIYDISVRVTDKQGISREKTWQLSDGVQIEHAFQSSSGCFVFDEPASFDIKLTNNDSQPLENITVIFSCDAQAVTLTDTVELLPLLDTGQSIEIQDAFAFLLSEPATDQTAFPCRFTLLYDGKTRERHFPLVVSSPDILMEDPGIEDGVNQRLDIGEIATLVIPLTNRGSIPASNLEVTLSTTDTAIKILSQPSLLLAEIGQKTSIDTYFQLKASRGILPGYEAPLTLEISDGSTIHLSFPFSLTVGSYPVAIVKLVSNTPSLSLMTALMDSLGVGYSVYDMIPDNLSDHPCAFLLLGTSYAGSYALSMTETLQLIAYLSNGGHAYMESYSSWYYSTTPMIEALFQFSTERVSVYYFNEIYGTPGTFTEGMDFVYPGPSPYAIFEVIPQGEGFSLFHNDDAEPKCLAFGYDGSLYKTIGTFIEFGYLANGLPPSEKARLFKGYLDFFAVNYEGPFPFFHADSTRICCYHPVQFTDDSFDNIIAWDWQFPGGIPAWSEEQNPVVSYTNAGLYDVILTVSDGVHAQTMHKKQYLHVQVCAGMTEEPTATESLRVWPNPASAQATVEIPRGWSHEFVLEGIDMQGRTFSRSRVFSHTEGQPVSIDVSSWTQGIYTIRLSSPDAVAFGRLAVIR